MPIMKRFLYATDLHGNEARYRRCLSLARELGADAIVNGGDMLPHARQPAEQLRFLREFLDPYFDECGKAGIHYLAIPGNDDLRAHDPVLEEIARRHPLVELIDGRLVEVGGWTFAGSSLVPDFPFRLKDRARMDTRDFVFPPQAGTAILSGPDGFEEVPDWAGRARSLPTIEDELARLPVPPDPSRAIYVLHGPPAGLSLDVVRGGACVGSKAMLRFLAGRQPLLSLHGHIHESPEESGVWRNTVGATVCVQPGQAQGGLTVVIVSPGTMELTRRVLPPG